MAAERLIYRQYSGGRKDLPLNTLLPVHALQDWKGAVDLLTVSLTIWTLFESVMNYLKGWFCFDSLGCIVTYRLDSADMLTAIKT